MNKKSFFDILSTITPEELNELISSKGKLKMVNAITFVDSKGESEDGKFQTSNNRDN